MKITDIQIKNFGVWKDVSFSLPSAEMNVVYGPNEAGKSTLLRFIRHVLYGFDSYGPTESHSRTVQNVWEGALCVDAQGTRCRIRRASRRGTRGLVSVSGLDQNAPADQLLDELLGGADEKLFESVFAIGLHELQVLATLQDDEAAKHIWGLSLGPEARKLLDVSDEIESRRAALFDVDPQSGELADLLKREQEIADELESVDDHREKHRIVCKERDELLAEIDNLKTRQAGFKSQLWGHLFLERVWKPWKQVRRQQAEWDALPSAVEFPQHGLERLEKTEAELQTATDARKAIRKTVRQLRKQASEYKVDRNILKHAGGIQAVLDQRPRIEELEQSSAALKIETAELTEQLDQKIADLGDGWSSERLATTETSPEAQFKMVSLAREYREAVWRRNRLRRRYNAMTKSNQKRSAELNERLKQRGIVSLDDSLIQTRQQLKEVENLGKLTLRETQLAEQQNGIAEELARQQAIEGLPRSIFVFLLGLLCAGALIACVGFYTGLTSNGIAGTALALVGLTAAGIACGLKQLAETNMQKRIEQLQDDLRANEINLHAAQESVQQISDSGTIGSQLQADGLKPDGEHTSEKSGHSLSHAEAIAGVAASLSDLEQWSQTNLYLQSRRERLGKLRGRIRNAQSEVSKRRGNWCRHLTSIGFEETVHLDEAFAAWQNVVEAAALQNRLQMMSEAVKKQREEIESYERQVESIGRGLPDHSAEGTQPGELAASWDVALQTSLNNRSRRRRYLKEINQHRGVAKQHSIRIDELRTRQLALFLQAGAGDREEFVQRAQMAAHRKELEEYLVLAKAELEEAARTEPDLAVVEEDLLDYDPQRNAAQVEAFHSELDELETDLASAHENLGGLKREIQNLESDRRSTKLRREREELRAELKRVAEQWFAVELAGRTVEKIRRRFERNCQPTTLSAASGFLEKLTGGKYRNVWAPLGERHLCLDEADGRTLRVEDLSNGTREQLFLAIRLATVGELNSRGIELPMVLDDVLVNFDEQRTLAAVETLVEFAGQGRQIVLFTCHAHLARLFESKGIEPIRLPASEQHIEERRAG